MSETSLDEEFTLPRVLAVLAGGLTVSQAQFLVDLATDPRATLRRFFAEILVEWILDGWAWLLATLREAFDALAGSVYSGMYDPLTAVFSPFYTVPRDFWLTLQDGLAATIASSGIAAPFVMFLSWGISATVVAGFAWILYGFAETYLPLESIMRPLQMGRRLISGLIPGGDR